MPFVSEDFPEEEAGDILDSELVADAEEPTDEELKKVEEEETNEE